MYFGLTNSPATFQTMMNYIYRNVILKHEPLGTTIRIYMDDIGIATRTNMSDHQRAVHDVLNIAQLHDLYFKPEKCIFHSSSMDYLGVILEKGVTRMDPAKIVGVDMWPTPRNATEVRKVLGFFNFYRPFIQDFAFIARPLHKLTRKDQEWRWGPEEQRAFDAFKKRVTSEPVLAHAKLDDQFELEVDASGYAVGAVLLQCKEDGKKHPIGYYSATLNEAQRNYDIYDFEIRHLPGRLNGRADALSRRPGYKQGEDDNKDVVVLPDRVFVRAAATQRAPPMQRILTQEEMEVTDPVYAQDEELLKPWINADHLKKIEGVWYKEGCRVVTGRMEHKRTFIRIHHNAPVYGHPGINKTYQLTSCRYWWPNMQQDVRDYVRGCAECQRKKINTRPTKAPLSPIFPTHKAMPFETIALDFITKLPILQGYNSILTVTDHDCSKATLFIPCKEAMTVEETAGLIMQHVFPRFGLPGRFISNRDP